MIHELKTQPEYFKAVKAGIKKFEYRKNDRNFQAGDLLNLMELDTGNGSITGNTVLKHVDYILYGGNMGVPKDYCVMSLSDVSDESC